MAVGAPQGLPQALEPRARRLRLALRAGAARGRRARDGLAGLALRRRHLRREVRPEVSPPLGEHVDGRSGGALAVVACAITLAGDGPVVAAQAAAHDALADEDRVGRPPQLGERIALLGGGLLVLQVAARLVRVRVRVRLG